jgi:hypothetical protein
MTLLEGSNYHQTRRHYATEMAKSKYYDGLEGKALCASRGITPRRLGKWTDTRGAVEVRFMAGRTPERAAA